jgi:hypothetical protein
MARLKQLTLGGYHPGHVDLKDRLPQLELNLGLPHPGTLTLKVGRNVMPKHMINSKQEGYVSIM